jgi:hypothetical protein
MSAAGQKRHGEAIAGGPLRQAIEPDIANGAPEEIRTPDPQIHSLVLDIHRAPLGTAMGYPKRTICPGFMGMCAFVILIAPTLADVLVLLPGCYPASIR